MIREAAGSSPATVTALAGAGRCDNPPGEKHTGRNPLRDTRPEGQYFFLLHSHLEVSWESSLQMAHGRQGPGVYPFAGRFDSGASRQAEEAKNLFFSKTFFSKRKKPQPRQSGCGFSAPKTGEE